MNRAPTTTEYLTAEGRVKVVAAGDPIPDGWRPANKPDKPAGRKPAAKRARRSENKAVKGPREDK